MSFFTTITAAIVAFSSCLVINKDTISILVISLSVRFRNPVTINAILPLLIKPVNFKEMTRMLKVSLMMTRQEQKATIAAGIVVVKAIQQKLKKKTRMTGMMTVIMLLSPQAYHQVVQWNSFAILALMNFGNDSLFISRLRIVVTK